MRKAVLLLTLAGWPLAAPAKVSLTGIAAGTTIAVNSGTVARWLRHPKREATRTAKQIKNVMKGKN